MIQLYFTAVNSPIEIAARKIGVSQKILQRLLTPENIHHFTLKIDSREFEAWRVQHNSSRGPYKGGIRYHQHVSEEELLRLARLMTLKTALLQLPLGGSKGGVKFDPKKETKKTIEKVTRAYVRALAKHIGPQKDIPAPDVNTGPETMAWILDEYSSIVGRHSPAVVTGKPIGLSGSEGRTEATGYGGFYVLEELIRQGVGNLPEKPTIAVQGIGNVGMNFEHAADNTDMKVVAISDSSGGIYNEEGIDCKKVAKFKQEGGALVDFNQVKHITNEELLELPVDVLVPAALENVINEENARKIKARLVLELANYPTTEEADEILEKRGVTLVPDILANAGGVTVSYFEWQQNLKREHWSKKEVFAKLEAKMRKATKDVIKTARKENVSLRTAAFIIALRRIVEADKKRDHL